MDPCHEGNFGDALRPGTTASTMSTLTTSMSATAISDRTAAAAERAVAKAETAIAMVGEWKPQNGQVRDEIDPSIPTDDKDFISSNTGMTDDDKDVATADEDTTGAGSASNMRKRGSMFQQCPHPDENLRIALSKRVGMDPLRVKFWFQNRRNAKKNQNERQQNMVLRTENVMLAEENRAMKAAMLKKTCPTCKGPMVFIKPLTPPELRRLHMENERLKAELLRRTAYLHGVSAGTAGSSRILCDLNVDPVVPPPPRQDDLMADTMGHCAPGGCASSTAGGAEHAALERHVLAALNELMMLMKQGEPMWQPAALGGEVLDHQLYRATTLPGLLELPPPGFTANGTRDTGMVMCTGADLVRIFMDENCWLETFPDIVSSVSASDIGHGCICQGGVILMNAGLRVLSPGVSSCNAKFLRQCQMIEQGVWAVVDVSLDAHGTSELRAWNTGLPGACRVLPSGCLIKDMNNGYCKVAMIVNAEYDKGFMPPLLHLLLSSGHTFSARRWLTSLQRRCEFLAQRLSPAYGISRAGGAITPEGRNNALELARRMTESFYVAISAPRGEAWRKVADWRGRESFQLAMHVLTPLAAPGEQAAGPVLCATTTVWLPEIPPQRVFDYICDGERRGEWDVLAEGARVQEEASLATAQFPLSGVSVLRPTAMARGRGRSSCNKKLILQQACSDAPCMVVAYAPIDAGELKDVMHGGSRASLSLLPSGFAILPDGVGDMQNDPLDANPSGVDPMDHQRSRGSLVSVLWQTPLVGGNLTAQTVDNVGNNVSGSIMKIRAALHAKRVMTV
ncbi:homeobox-leucine zipper protein ROC6-like [Aegilops tauschii subsp. strangulata]|uniref:homeobox-leucine zipper protein ROC6-like n=1 Tax=Aegilops tauschii subsp. strangulata TaxID=200361 RepID=UPI001ABCDE69